MTRAEIAEELEAWLYNGGGDTTQLQRDVMDKIDALVATAVKAERERCARVCADKGNQNARKAGVPVEVIA